jgi:hypothetical protein
VHDFGTAWFQAADGKPTHIGLWIWTYWFRFPFPKDWFQFKVLTREVMARFGIPSQISSGDRAAFSQKTLKQVI